MSRNVNLLAESDVVKLQRDLDNYTRKLEQEKRFCLSILTFYLTFYRRLFSLEEAHNIVLKEFRERKTRMDKMTSPSKLEKKQLDVQIGNLQNQLETVILD